jgi:ketoreductase RED1
VASDASDAARDADIVQENGPENVEFKKDLFATLVRDAPKHALLASSSSAIPSTAFTGEIEDAGRILIGHPFNPPHLIPLVEIVPGKRTSEDAVSTAVDFYTFLGRTPVVERKEMPGFVGNRLQNALNAKPATSSSRAWYPRRPRQGGHQLAGHSLRHHRAVPQRTPGRGPRGYRHLADHIGKEMDKMELGEVTQDPKVQERLIEAVEKTYGAYSYAALRRTRPQATRSTNRTGQVVSNSKKAK